MGLALDVSHKGNTRPGHACVQLAGDSQAIRGYPVKHRGRNSALARENTPLQSNEISSGMLHHEWLWKPERSRFPENDIATEAVVVTLQRPVSAWENHGSGVFIPIPSICINKMCEQLRIGNTSRT